MSRPLAVIVLAAGQGTRLRPLTANKPKCLVEIGGISILERQLSVLRQNGVKDITIVTGFEGNQIRPSDCRTVANPAFATTNMVESLVCAHAQLCSDEDVIISYGDILYEPRVLSSIVEEPAELAVTVDMIWQGYWLARFGDLLEDSETLRLGPSGLITEIGDTPTSINDIDARYVGLLKVAGGFGHRIVDAYRSLKDDYVFRGRTKHNLYMTDLLQIMIDSDQPVHAACVQGGWLEIDSVADVSFIEATRAKGTLSEFCEIAEVKETLCA